MSDQKVLDELGVKYTEQDLSLDKVRASGHNFRRIPLDTDRVEEYARAMNNGNVFPPIVVHREGDVFYVDAGYHRLNARIKGGYSNVRALVVDLDVQNEADNAKLRTIRIKTNLVHGLGLDMTERLTVATDRVQQGESLDDVAKDLNLDSAKIKAMIEERQYDRQLVTKLGNAVNLAAFPIAAFKRALCKTPGLGTADLKALQSVAEKYAGEKRPDGAKRLSAGRFSELCKAIGSASDDTKVEIYAQLDEELHTKPQKAKRQSHPFMPLSAVKGQVLYSSNIRRIGENPHSVDELVRAISAETEAAALADNIKMTVDALRAIHDALRAKFDLPKRLEVKEG